VKFIISLVTRFIPRHYLHRVSHFFLSIVGVFYLGKKYQDPIDGKNYRKLLPYGRINPRKNALAPFSMSLERHRLLWIFLKEKTNFFSDNLEMLHVAPEYCFIKRFKKLENLKYITADLISPWADVKMDVQEIPYTENTFDVIMCNHVLEHVDDDMKAMKEFYRVMKLGGWGIFQVPIDYSRETTYYNPEITDPREREEHFWQSDHLRLYGKNYGKVLAQAGFTVEEVNLISELPRELVHKYALPKEEIIYLCKKI
jgi:predicted SAM-dependent methyltransferase